MVFNLNEFLQNDDNLDDDVQNMRASLAREHSLPRLSILDGFRRMPRIQCADGLSLSVQAGSTAYCAPRNGTGPWTQVEVGFPSERIEELMEYAEDPNEPTETVYGWVPIEIVEAVIEQHGGFAGVCAPPCRA